MRKLLAIVLLAIAGGALGQSGNFPALVGQRGTTLPTNCTIGQLFFDTDATAGGNIYGCTSANTWTQMEGGSAITGCTYAANVLTCPTITATTALRAPANTPSSVVIGFNSTSGFTNNAGDDGIAVYVSGGRRYYFGTNPAAFKVASTYSIGWTDTTDAMTGASDLRLTRYAAKQLMISGDGTGATTNAGLTLGYAGSASFGGIVISGTALTTSSYNILATPTSTWIGTPTADGVIYFFPSAAGSQKMALTATGGAGPSITAGTATTAVSPLAMAQTWNAGSVTFPGLTLTVTNSASATGSKFFNFIEGSTSRLSLDVTGYLEGTEQTAPSAPAANGYRLYAQDSGGGKTQLCALFNSGAAQCFATEP